MAATSLLFLAADAAAIVRRNGASPSCPGYKASNVKTVDGEIVSADLNLAGPACNVYGTDLDDLKLQVEYQSGKSHSIAVCSLSAACDRRLD